MAVESKEAKLARYQLELDRARQFLKDEGYVELWDRMVNLYRGRHYDKASMSDRLIINMAFPTINAIAPSVSVNNPKFAVFARKPDSAHTAVVTEAILNYLWRTHKYHQQFRLAVDDFLMIGHGWIKVGWKQVKELREVLDEDHEQDGPGIDDREAGGEDMPQSETEQKISDDRPFVQRISWKDMFVDPDARNMDELRWIAQRVRRPVSDVKVDERYSKAARNKVQPTAWANRNETGDNPHEEAEQKGIGYVDVIEFYDLRARTVSTFAADCGTKVGFLIEPRKIPYAFGHPFTMLRNYEIPDYFYPMGELEQIESLQLELNETRTQMLNHRKRNARKYLIRKQWFDQEALDALQSNEDNTMVPVTGSEPLKDVVHPMDSLSIGGDLYDQSARIMDDINIVSATNEYARGDTPNIRRTATEAAMIQDAQNARAADKLTQVETFLADIGCRVIQVMQQFLTGKQVARIVGLRSAPMWIQYDRHYIAGEFDYEVEGGSTQPRNESFRRQSALQLMDAIGPFIGQVVDPVAVARRVLMDFGMKDPESFLLAPQPQPMAAAPAGPQLDASGNGVVGPPPSQDPMESEVQGIPQALINQVEAQSGVEFAA